MVGSLFRQLILIRLASPSHPYLFTSRFSIISRVTPWSGSFGFSGVTTLDRELELLDAVKHHVDPRQERPGVEDVIELLGGQAAAGVNLE